MAGDMALLVKPLPCRHEDLSSDLQEPTHKVRHFSACLLTQHEGRRWRQRNIQAR